MLSRRGRRAGGEVYLFCRDVVLTGDGGIGDNSLAIHRGFTEDNLNRLLKSHLQGDSSTRPTNRSFDIVYCLDAKVVGEDTSSTIQEVTAET